MTLNWWYGRHHREREVPHALLEATDRRTHIMVRAAVDADGEQIGALVWRAGFTVESIDWTHIQPYWLVAEVNGTILGAIQMCPGKPMARLELLSIDEGVRLILKGRLVKMLLRTACYAMQRAGAQIVCGVIPGRLASYRTVLERHGARKLSDGTMYLYWVR